MSLHWTYFVLIAYLLGSIPFGKIIARKVAQYRHHRARQRKHRGHQRGKRGWDALGPSHVDPRSSQRLSTRLLVVTPLFRHRPFRPMDRRRGLACRPPRPSVLCFREVPRWAKGSPPRWVSIWPSLRFPAWWPSPYLSWSSCVWDIISLASMVSASSMPLSPQPYGFPGPLDRGGRGHGGAHCLETQGQHQSNPVRSGAKMEGPDRSGKQLQQPVQFFVRIIVDDDPAPPSLWL